ncbi:hypothetical protein GQ457_15G018800 [Hibiscus cannabinus]
MQYELATDVILQSLSDNFKQFILKFNMNEIDKTLPHLLGILYTAKRGISKDGKCFHCDKPGHLKKNLPSLS